MRPPAIVTYLALRTALLLAVAGLLALAGLRGVPLVAVALIGSSILALPLLSRPRDGVSLGISRRLERTRQRIDEASRSEDD